MKTVVAILPCILAVLTLQAAEPAKKHSLSLSVKPLATGGGTRTKNDLAVSSSASNRPGTASTRSQDYSTVREKSSGLDLEVEVRNLSSLPDNAQIEWILLAKSVNEGDAYVCEEGKQDVAVGPASATKITIEATELQVTVERKLEVKTTYDTTVRENSTAKETKSGEKRAGWIVRMLADGVVLQVRSSSPTLESLAADPKRLAAIKRKLVKK